MKRLGGKKGRNKGRDKGRSNGLTLLEMAVGLSIGAVSMIAFTSLIKLQTNNNRKVSTRTEFTELANLIRFNLAAPASCTTALASALPSGGSAAVVLDPTLPAHNITAANPLLVSNLKIANNSTYGHVKISSLQITNVKPAPSPCPGCEFHRSIDLIMTADTAQTFNTSANLDLSTGDTRLTTAMTILAEVDGAQHFSACLDTSFLQAQEACESSGGVWDPAPPGTCTGQSPIFNIVAQNTISVAPQGTTKPTLAASIPPASPAGPFELCFLTGITGGGQNAFEGAQVTGSCAAGWQVWAWNNEPVAGGKTFFYDWSCMHQSTCK